MRSFRASSLQVLINLLFFTLHECDSFVLSFRGQRNGGLKVQNSKTSRLADSINEDDGAETPFMVAEYPEPVTSDIQSPHDEKLTQGLESSLSLLPEHFLTLPRHSNTAVNVMLQQTENMLRKLHKRSKHISTLDNRQVLSSAKNAALEHEVVYANSYVDLGKIDIIGFDFDYTLVTYTEELLDLIYDMALKRLVSDRQYPLEMLDMNLKFDPCFSIRGLAVDKETGWITHLSYTHKVTAAWEGREKLPTSRIYDDYNSKRALRPDERRKRLKPLNDLFSMAECCLIADTIQFFKDRAIPYAARNVVTDVLNAVTETHLSGDFHRLVAQNPERYFFPTPHLKQLLQKYKESGKKLIFVSNSPFWYVDAGMQYIFGAKWRDEWDAIITSAGKPSFYTEGSRPFREVSIETRRLMFKRVDRFESGKVYTEGCLKELMRLMDWTQVKRHATEEGMETLNVAPANVLYIGDSLFADLVDAKREYGWTTAAVVPEIGYELAIQNQPDFALAQQTIGLILNALRRVQEELGADMHTSEDMKVLDSLERLVSMWRDRETLILGNPFGSVFRARYQPSLFASSLRRYSDLYMTSVSSLRQYSPQHRFYPNHNHRLLAHETQKDSSECWSLDEVLASTNEE
jgi:HAD superfamily 5'-nucleotidase-like hydrolase